MKHFKTFFKKRVFFLLLTAVGILYCQGSFSQNSISGTVKDEKGEALTGVSVQIKNTTTGTVTDIDGTYTLYTSATNPILIFSYLGFTTQEIPLNNRKVLDIVLMEDNKLLDEVVVVGYGTQKKGMLTGSISSVKSDKLTTAPIGNATNTLAGQLPGVIAKQISGAPGDDAATISIRGFDAPLVLIDGIEAPLNNVDPWQIESISVLKDGAASIYGARAGNGVVLITTKRGTTQKPTISVNSSFTLQGSTKINKPQSSGQRARLMRETHLNQGLPESQVPYTEEQIEKYFKGDDPHYLNSDWFDAAIRDYAPQHNHNISISGGSENLKYYGFFGYNNQETIIKKDGGSYNRYNFQSSIDAKIIDNLTLTVDVNSIYEDRNFSYLGLFGGSNLWRELYNSDPRLAITLPDENKLAYGGIPYGNIIAGSSTKIGGYSKTRSRNHRAGATLAYDVEQIPGLKLKAFININETNEKLKEFRKQHNFYLYNIDTEDYTFARSSQDPTKLTESNSYGRTFTQQYSISYENLFNETHRVSALALYENIDYSGDSFSASRAGFMSNSIEQLIAGSLATASNSGNANEMGRVSWVGRLNYSYKDKYLLETIFRADASAKFPSSDRWGYFPSVSLGWVMSQERFMEKLGFVDNIKLRASYGESGNDAVGNFQFLSGYGFDGQYILGDQTYTGLYVTGIANPTLTWEKMKIYNGGIDFSFLGRRLYGTIDAFYRERKGIPGRRHVSLPSSFGTTLPLENLNDINTRGFELMIGTSQKFGELALDLSGTLTWARSKWDKYDEPDYTDPDQKRLYELTGKWTDRQMGYVSDGLFTSQEQIDNLPYTYSDLNGNSSLRPGDVIYKDLNNDGVFDWKDQKVIGSGSTPRWVYGINGAVKYKGFDLAFLFQGAFGYSTYVNMESVLTELAYDNRWTSESNDSESLVPRPGGAATNAYHSDYRLHKTSYLRLKNAAIGYEIPERLLSKAKIKRIRIYLAGTNLFTLSSLRKYGVDPEMPDGNGITGMPVNTVLYYPQQRTFSVGVNLSF